MDFSRKTSDRHTRYASGQHLATEREHMLMWPPIITLVIALALPAADAAWAQDIPGVPRVGIATGRHKSKGAPLELCGQFVTQWGSTGAADGNFEEPRGVAVDGSGNVFVADPGNNHIQKFTNTGTFLTQWGSSGTGDGQFVDPRGVAVDGSGNVFVVDSGNERIEKFTNTGTFLTKWGTF